MHSREWQEVLFANVLCSYWCLPKLAQHGVDLVECLQQVDARLRGVQHGGHLGLLEVHKGQWFEDAACQPCSP